MHSTACGISAASSSSNNANASSNQQSPPAQTNDSKASTHNAEEPSNKIPPKSGSLDDEEKNAGDGPQDTAAAEEARREQMRENILTWMKKLTIVVICFIGITLIAYVIISLCLSEWPRSSHNNSTAKALASNSTINTTTMMAPQPPTPSPLKLMSTTTPTIPIAITTLASAATSPSSPSESSLLPDKGAAKEVTTAPANVTSINKPEINTAAAAAQSDDMLHDEVNLEEKFQSKLGIYKEGVVASDRAICSRIGSDVLKKNGSAVDAAIAALFCNGLTNMHSMGIGGGMLMNVYIKDEGRAFTIDARDVTPYSATPELFETLPDTRTYGGLAVNVPGELMGYARAHEKFGKLKWKELIEPSLALCKEGFRMSTHQFKSLKSVEKSIKNDTLLNKMFFNNETGEPLPAGTIVRPPKQLCKTYRMLAENGARDFYTGNLSTLVLEDLKDMGSLMTSYDLQTYEADLVSSITMQFGNDTLHVMPPVSSGTVVAHVLSILEGFNFTAEDMADDEKKALTLHRFVEALKFAFAKRGELGDMRFNDCRELVSKLTNPEFGNEIRAMINDSAVQEDIDNYGALYQGADDRGTSHLSVLAPNGDAVSVTSSVNHYFGNHMMGQRTGIIFNSGLYDFSFPKKNLDIFSLPPSESNYVDSHKRPMSSMSPVVLTTADGDVRMVLGAAGGSRIISAVAQVMARVLWFGQDIKEAIDAPRFHHQLIPNVFEYEEKSLNETILKILTEKGHKLAPQPDAYSVVVGIVRNATAIYANADWRKRGSTHGF